MSVSINKWPHKNLTSVTIGDLSIWFSYETPIAINDGTRLVVAENQWGPTTGKHLSYIDGGAPEEKAIRLSAAEFAKALAAVSTK
jgi:hypothetical protein